MGFKQQPHKQYVKYVPVGYVDTHHLALAYIAWLFGIFGAHRFFLGRPWSGLLYLLTLGLLGIGWIVDLFLIPGMVQDCRARYQIGAVDYNVAWLLLWIGGIFGLHRFYQGKFVTGIVYLLTGGLLFIGVVYDVLTMNEQIDELNSAQVYEFQLAST